MVLSKTKPGFREKQYLTEVSSFSQFFFPITEFRVTKKL